MVLNCKTCNEHLNSMHAHVKFLVKPFIVNQSKAVTKIQKVLDC